MNTASPGTALTGLLAFAAAEGSWTRSAQHERAHRFLTAPLGRAFAGSLTGER